MSRFCVVEGTKITLNDKETVPIEKIKVGQEILSFNLNTLQKSQKYDILVKLKTNNFDGIFQEDLVKNVWKNTVDEYYLINNKLKITKDHIVLVKRNNIYYWTKVEQLLLNDYLFTELNIFEKISSIIIVKEPVKVFNLEVNRVFNYFANSYLIHNGAPCSVCGDACGIPDITITQNTPGGYKYQVLSGYTTATVTVAGAMGSLFEGSNPEDDPTGRGAIIAGSFTVSAGSYIYYFVGEGDGSNFSSITTSSGAGVTEENYNGGGFGANRRDDAAKHGYKGGGSSFIAYSDSSSLVTIHTETPKSSQQLENFSSDSLKETILVVAGGGGGQTSYDETHTHFTSAGTEGGNGGNAEGDSSNSNTSNDITWITGVTGTFIMGTKGNDSLAEPPYDNQRGGGFPGGDDDTSGAPTAVGGIGGTAIPGYGGGPHSEQAGSFGKAGFDTGPGGYSSESVGFGAGNDAYSTPIPGGPSAHRGGGGGGGIYGGGAGSLGGGGGGGGLSYYKKTDSSGGTVFNYTQASSGKRDAIHSGNTVIDDPTVSEDDFNGYIQIILT